MEYGYKTDLVTKLTGATSNQLKYWSRIGLVIPEITGRRAQYSFRDIVKLRILVSLRKKGLKPAEGSFWDQPPVGDASG